MLKEIPSLAEIPASESTFRGFVSFEVPEIKSRQGLRLEAGLFDREGMPEKVKVNDLSFFSGRCGFQSEEYIYRLLIALIILK